MYSAYHDKGLEVVSVSNDYDLDTPKAVIASDEMPWPELFDADAAANKKWNPITTGQKITGIRIVARLKACRESHGSQPDCTEYSCH